MEQTTRHFLRTMGRWLMALLLVMLTSLATRAAEAYACYTPENTTLTFYYDSQRDSRTGTTYDLNTGSNYPGWSSDGTYSSVTRAVFDPSFVDARPTSTLGWFYYMNQLQSITGMEYLNTSEVTDMSDMFDGCSKLTSLDVSNFNTANVTDMSHMFSECFRLTSLDLSSFNTSNVTSMVGMFQNSDVLTSIDLSSFNTANVTDMHSMFFSCRGLTSLDLSSFNTSKVTDMRWMFEGCTGLTSLDLSNFNTAKVTYMNYMFYGCTNLTTIYAGDGWSTEAVTESSYMFRNCTSLVGGKGTTYNSSNPTDATYAHIDGGTSNPGYFTEKVKEAYACYTPENTTLTFYYDSQRDSRPGTTYDLNTGSNYPAWYNAGIYSSVLQVVFDASFADARPTSAFYWFSEMNKLQTIEGLANLNTSEVTNMASMFSNCRKLTSLDLSTFNTDKVTTTDCMFLYCTGLTSVDLRGFTNAKLTRTSNMFEGCSALTTIYADSNWSLPADNYSWAMFMDCTSLVGGKGTAYDENHTDDSYAHLDGGPSNPGYFTEKVDEAYACYTPSNTTLTFYYDSQRASRPGTTYDLNTDSNNPDWYSDGTSSSVTRVEFAESFADVRPTSTYMWFYGMENVHSITGLNYLNTENVTNMGAMFMSCTVLASLDLSSFNTANVTGMSCMFLSCYALTSLDVSNFNTAKVTNMHEMFAGCSGLTSLDVSSFNTANVTNMRYMFSGCSGLTSLDVSSFNIENVVYMHRMFSSCSGLKTIYVGDGWSTAAVTESTDMFYNCTRLVGGMGTTYDANHTDKTYAHIDGGPSNPGYFTAKNASLRGDVDADGNVTISDVTALIDYLLSGNASEVNLTAADCDLDGGITISDVTALIDYLLSGRW